MSNTGYESYSTRGLDFLRVTCLYVTLELGQNCKLESVCLLCIFVFQSHLISVLLLCVTMSYPV